MTEVSSGGSDASGFEAVIGLEIHCQLATRSKIFCACPVRLEEGQSVSSLSPNSNACPICAGHPGALPVLNQRVLELAVMAGVGLGCKVQSRSVIARKNYFYPDLPKGYQMSQHEEPLCVDGAVEVQGRLIRVQRIHIEEDAGKSLHFGTHSAVNLNRAGTPLIEIVSHPDLRTAAEAAEYMRSVYAVVTSIGVCEGNLQEGNFRCDANVSVRPKGSSRLGTRCEIKNVNSFRFVERAIDYEILRQTAIVQGGGRVQQETRSFDSDRGRTESMRSKEEAEDYRYFPDPDLLPISLSSPWVERIKNSLPELPRERLKRYREDLGLSASEASWISLDPDWSRFFEEALEAGKKLFLSSGNGSQPMGQSSQHAQLARGIAVLICGELTRLRNDSGVEALQSKLQPSHLSEVAWAVLSQEISNLSAKALLQELWASGGKVPELIDQKGYRQNNDLSFLEDAVKKVIAAFPSQVADYRNGKEKILGFLVGQVMKATQGKSNPAAVGELIKRLLAG